MYAILHITKEHQNVRRSNILMHNVIVMGKNSTAAFFGILYIKYSRWKVQRDKYRKVD